MSLARLRFRYQTPLTLEKALARAFPRARVEHKVVDSHSTPEFTFVRLDIRAVHASPERFIQSRCHVDARSSILFSRLYDLYVFDCRRKSVPAESKSLFSQELKRAFPSLSRKVVQITVSRGVYKYEKLVTGVVAHPTQAEINFIGGPLERKYVVPRRSKV